MRGREQGRPVRSEGQCKGWGELRAHGRAQGQEQVSLPPLSNPTAHHAILYVHFLDFPGKGEMK